MFLLNPVVLFLYLMLSETWAKKVVHNTDPCIYYHGRWDKSPGTWWYVRIFVSGTELVERYSQGRFGIQAERTKPEVTRAESRA